MPPLQLYLAFIAASALLILIPGPNVALIVANSVAHGTRFGLMTVAGTASAMVVQLALTVAGATAVLDVLAASFDWLRWAGVAYLMWLGIAAWRAPVADLGRTTAEPRSLRRIYLRGFLVGLTNPKTLLFYGAFLPQFIVPESASGADVPHQLLLLAATFLVVAVALDGLWAAMAGRLRAFLVAHARWRNRVTGGLLMGAGLGLALARRSS
ncbi:MAG: LysE family translocator [Alphaproteobacteria bacterium]|nr:LysE family translocator [Alphaproteobacteria bacterium]